VDVFEGTQQLQEEAAGLAFGEPRLREAVQLLKEISALRKLHDDAALVAAVHDLEDSHDVFVFQLAHHYVLLCYDLRVLRRLGHALYGHLLAEVVAAVAEIHLGLRVVFAGIDLVLEGEVADSVAVDRRSMEWRTATGKP